MYSKRLASTLVVFSADLPESACLLEAIRPEAQKLAVSSDSDAIECITEALSNRSVSRLVLLSHGRPGQVILGKQSIDAETIHIKQRQIADWGVKSIDIYACDVAQDTAFITALSNAARASVAASDQPVGHKSLGGSWRLNHGDPEESVFDSRARERWMGVLADPSPVFRATSANPGEAESISLYLVNQMRHAPQTWATILNVDLDKDFRGNPVRDFLSGAAISLTATDSIIYDDILASAAFAYAGVLPQYPYLDHTLPGVGPSDSDNKTYPWTRAAFKGYTGGNVTENLAYNLASDAAVAALTNEQKARTLVGQLFIDDGVADAGHRVNILLANHTEAGFGFTVGALESGYRKYFVVQKFGTESGAADKPYLTGFALSNGDGNLQYNQGEGLGGVTISITDNTDGSTYTTTTGAYGYWDFQAAGGHSYTVTASGGSYVGSGVAANVSIDSGGTNGYNSRSIDFFSGVAAGRVDFGIPGNSAVSGGISILGDPVVGQTLTVDTSSLVDADGIGSFKFTWFVNGIEITDGFGLSSNPDASITASSLFLSGKLLGPNVILATEGSASSLGTGDWLVGKRFSVVVSYTDGKGTLEAKASAQTAPVTNMTVQQALANLNNPIYREISVSDSVANLLVLANDLTTLSSSQLAPYHKIRDFHPISDATLSIADNTKLYQAIYKVKGWSDCFSENEFYTKYSAGKITVSTTADILQTSLIGENAGALHFLPSRIELTGGSISASNLAYSIESFGASKLVRAPGATITVTGNIDALSTTERARVISFLGDTSAPAFIAASASSGTNSLTLTFSETLAGATAPTSAFSVIINGVAQQPTAVSTSGAKVVLSLAAGLTLGDSVTVTYTSPATGDKITDVSGNGAAGIPSTEVSVQASAPVFQSAATNAAGDKIILTYDRALSTTTAATTSFTIIPYDSGTWGIPYQRTVLAASVSGNTVELTLDQAINNGRNPIDLWYDDPTAGNDAAAIQEPTGVDALSLSEIAVTNIVTIASTWLGTTANNSWTGTAGSDEAYANLGSDTLYGMGGNDILDLGYYTDSSGGSLNDTSANEAYGGDGNDEIYGTNGNDILSGENGDDMLYASGGVDTLIGGDGNDEMYGRSGNDQFTGGAGHDLIDGGTGSGDVAVFSLARAAYTVSQSGSITTVSAKQGVDGIDKIKNIEIFRFADSDVSLNDILIGNVSNSEPTGSVSISGTPIQGQTLTASNTLVDADGIPASGSGALSYQWKADGNAISGATSSTYTLTHAEIGKTITVIASYTDNQGTVESITSNATGAVAQGNTAPTAINVNTNSIGENNAINAVVGILSTLDPDATDEFIYSLVSGDGDSNNALFSISGNQLQANTVFDYESQSSYTIRIRSTDSGGLFTEKIKTLNILDANEAPTALSLNNVVSSLSENNAVTSRIKLADISLMDDALGANSFFLNGADASYFEVVGSALYLRANTNLSFAAKPNYALSLASNDLTLPSSTPLNLNYSLAISDAPPTAPTVSSLLSGSSTPTIGGSIQLETGGTLEVIVNGSTYTVANGLSISGSSWQLAIPTALSNGTYEIVARHTDATHNVSVDTTSNELTVEASTPVRTVELRKATGGDGAEDGGADGSTSATPSRFRISRSHADPAPLTLYYTLSGSAQAGIDYLLPNNVDSLSRTGSVTIEAGSKWVDLSLPTLNNSSVNGVRTLTASLINNPGYSIGSELGASTATLVDNEVASPPAAPVFSISDQQLLEGSSGAWINRSLRVDLNTAASQAVSVDLTFSLNAVGRPNGTASSNDYQAISRRLTMAAGTTSLLIDLQVMADTLVENPSEFFYATLSNVSSGASISSPSTTAQITIRDDDQGQTIDLSSASSGANPVNGSSQADSITGTPFNDVIFAGAGNDTVRGGGGRDDISLGDGADRLIYGSFSSSSLSSTADNVDRIIDFDPANGDRFQLTSAPSQLWSAGVIAQSSLLQAVQSVFQDRNPALAGLQTLQANEAVLFRHGTGRSQRFLLGVNDGNLGYQAGNDLLVDITGANTRAIALTFNASATAANLANFFAA